MLEMAIVATGTEYEDYLPYALTSLTAKFSTVFPQGPTDRHAHLWSGVGLRVER